MMVAKFNPAPDAFESESRFSTRFNREISRVMDRISQYFGQLGEFGSLARYDRKQPSDWWMSQDFGTDSRVLSVDLLNPNLQAYRVIEGVRDVLDEFEHEWMLLAGHDNDFNDVGEHVGETGEYYFWIRKSEVAIYAERERDLRVFFRSLRTIKHG